MFAFYYKTSPLCAFMVVLANFVARGFGCWATFYSSLGEALFFEFLVFWGLTLVNFSLDWQSFMELLASSRLHHVCPRGRYEVNYGSLGP